ncbi:helix-turn-helix transcriptional regulator [Ochrobactrum sp. MC-1LL]|uniref:helix-turn-helix domain-containing protein n=1 Tax=Ochrobactrum sp. MC-1LL TaxID=2735351 RepID=UPI00336BDE1B
MCVTHIVAMKQAIDILAFRESIGWSQERLAEELGVNRSSISRWEQGKASLRGPARKVIERLIAESSSTAPKRSRSVRASV